MKSNSFLSVLFILLFSFTMYSQYPVDLNISPNSPIPLKYTLEHFNLKGPVKEMDDTFAVITFNEDGRLISETSIYGKDDKFIYDDYGKLIQKETKMFGDISVYKIITDVGNRVIESSLTKVGDKFTYDSKGNYFEKYNIYDKMVYERHFYDTSARVIKSEFYYPIINTSSIKTYSYKKDGDFLVVETNYTSSDPKKKPTNSTTYFKNGNFYGKAKNDNLQYDSYGNPLSYLDKDGNVDSAITYTYYDGSSPSEEKKADNSEVIKTQDPSSISKSYCESGDCVNGWGKYKYENGNYEGFWKNGKKHGYGFYNWEGLGNYGGNWKEDKLNGYGTYVSNNNENLTGFFSNGQLDGLGFKIIDDTWTFGVYSEGNLVTNHTFYGNNVETGCIAGDCQNKYGRLKYTNGDIYSGFFKNGKLVMGIYHFKNGDKYEGMFNDNNQFHGTGRYFYKDGSIYGGEWVDGSMQGRGYYQNSSFEQQIGEWNKGTLIKSLKK